MHEAEAAAKNFPDVTLREMDVDAMAADLYSRPQCHDVILITNMFGDILSNAAVAMSGGLGLAASLNAGDNFAAANAGHGSAPDIAGKGIANPIALLLAAAMMLDHCKLPELATRLRRAIDETLNVDKVRTDDLGGTAGTAAFTNALVSRIVSR